MQVNFLFGWQQVQHPPAFRLGALGDFVHGSGLADTAFADEQKVLIVDQRFQQPFGMGWVVFCRGNEKEDSPRADRRERRVFRNERVA